MISSAVLRTFIKMSNFFFYVFTLTVMIQKENLFDFSRKKHDNFVKLILDLL